MSFANPEARVGLNAALHQQWFAIGEVQIPLDRLAEGREFELLASADRSYFVLRSKPDLFVAHLRGEEATRFKADYEAIGRQHPLWQSDHALGRLWDQGGYSWLAAQETD
ncbi:MAG: hypothetical protein ACLP8B_22265 [Xanthobacteraceae bacterium]|jgi:hypothetical protein